MDHCWGIFRALVDLLLKLDEGKYLLVKDPNKELLRLYAVPEDAFESNYANEDVEVEEDAVPADKDALLPAVAADEVADE
jgi:translation initiation factor 3 subunit D